VSGSGDRTVKVWDLASGACAQTLEGHSSVVRSVAVAGAHIVSGSGDTTIKVWDLASGACVLTLDGHSDAVWSVALSSDGKQIVSGSSDSTVKVWDLASGACVRTLEGPHSSLVMSVALSSDGRHLVSGGDDGTVKVWPMRHGRRVPHALIRQRVGSTHATAFAGLALLERQLYLERQLINFVYGGCNDDAGPGAEDKVLPDDLFPLVCQFLE